MSVDGARSLGARGAAAAGAPAMTQSLVSALVGCSVDEVLGQMPAGVVVVEARSRAIVYANAEARQLFEQRLGRPVPADMTPEPDWEIFHPDGRPCPPEERPLKRSLTTGEEVVEEEYFGVRPDGRRVIMRCSSWPIYDQQREIVAGVFVVSDVTQERHAQEQLAYHARLADIVEDAVVGTDPEFRLTVWNAGAERLYGYAAGEVLGRDARDIASYTGDTSRIQMESELLSSDRARVEITACRKDGTRLRVELVAVAVRGELGEIHGYLGIHREVSDRKHGNRVRPLQRPIEAILESITELLHRRRAHGDRDGADGATAIAARAQRRR
jgi:PAS domain S-box-containing protein